MNAQPARERKIINPLGLGTSASHRLSKAKPQLRWFSNLRRAGHAEGVWIQPDDAGLTAVLVMVDLMSPALDRAIDFLQ